MSSRFLDNYHPYWLGLAVTGGMIDCVNSSDETDSGHWTRICIYGGILKLYATVFVIKLICSFKDQCSRSALTGSPPQ